MNVNQNEYILYKQNKYNNHIIGFYTDSIVTCSLFLISINNDQILFFSDIDESSKIVETFEEKIIPILSNKCLNNIKIIYTKGVGSIGNSVKESHITEVIERIDKIFLSKKIVYTHTKTTSCLKLIKNLGNKNEELMYNIIKFKSSIIKKASSKIYNEISLFNNIF